MRERGGDWKITLLISGKGLKKILLTPTKFQIILPLKTESDREALELQDADTDIEREAREEEGYEGMRFLLGSQDMALKVQPTINGESVYSLQVLENIVELSENQDIRLMGPQELEMETQLVNEGNLANKEMGFAKGVQIGKVGITWEKIKSAGKTFNIEVIEKELMDDTKLVKEKGDRSSTRRKGIERELHNLHFNINYD